MECKRCGNSTILNIAESPVRGKWVLYKCSKCSFMWRSNETTMETHRLTEKEMQDLSMI